jgi:hypothetical protein
VSGADHVTKAQIRKRIDAIQEQLNELRVLALGESGDEPGPGWEWQRMANFLRHFVEAPGHSLPVAKVSALARAEGYDPRGIGGFYRGGAPALRQDGRNRILTEAGHKLYQEALTWVEAR